MVRISDEHIEGDEDDTEIFDTDEFMALIEHDLLELGREIGIEAVWLNPHPSGIGVMIAFDYPMISNGTVPDDMLEPRTAMWIGHLGTDYEASDTIAVDMFAMLKSGLSKEV